MSVFLSPESALSAVNKQFGWGGRNVFAPVRDTSDFTCPHCNTMAQHRWGVVLSVTYFTSQTSAGQRNTNAGSPLVMAYCSACNKETIFYNNQVIVPSASAAPLPIDELPATLLPDYLEARAILAASPRGAAALLRLLIQKLLPILGATKTEINAAIGELVKEGIIPSSLQMALDTVRVVGNEAVHPGTIDLEDNPDVAISLFRLVNIIVEKAIKEPADIKRLYASLPQHKLDGIANRDKT